MKPLRLRTPSRVRQITVIEAEATRGEGIIGDPVRLVTQYWSLDGDLLAERDVHRTPEIDHDENSKP